MKSRINKRRKRGNRNSIGRAWEEVAIGGKTVALRSGKGGLLYKKNWDLKKTDMAV